MSFFYEIYRWFLRKYLKQDYVRFEINSSCTGVIKSCVPLKSTMVRKIQKSVAETGYLTRKQQNTLLIQIGVYLAESKVLKGSKYQFGCQYLRNFKKGTWKLVLTLSED